MNIVQLFHRSVSKYPEKACVMYKSDGQYQAYTYQEVWSMVMRFASGLHACGISKGDRVGILSTNCPEWPITDFAVLTIQGIVVPVYPTLPSNQVHYILQHAGVKCVIAQDEVQLQKLYEHWPETLEKVILIQSSRTSHDYRVISFSDVLRMGNERNEGISNDTIEINRTFSPEDVEDIDEEQVATIVYTSGTSGTPKGVMLSHSNIVSNVLASTSYLPVTNTDVTLSYLPLSHIFERTVGQYAALAFGATIAYAESIDTILNNLQEVKPTLLVTVPRLLEKVYTRIQERIQTLPRVLRAICQKGLTSKTNKGFTYRLVDSLIFKKVRQGLGGNMQFVVSGGAGLAANIAEFFMKAGIPIYEGYGMTETSPVICCNPRNRARPGTVGQAIPGVEVAIASDGELLVRGPNLMLGYYNAPDQTAKTITEDGWLHTGDIAEITNGYVKIVDRKKNLLVLATGKNVAPWPIENAISLSTYISETILIGDKRQYVTCLVFPDFQSLSKVAEELQLENDWSVWVKHPKIVEMIRQDIASRVAPFASFEQPKRAILMPFELSLDTGELTPTLKIRNQTIITRYADLIESMYNGESHSFSIFEPYVPSTSTPAPTSQSQSQSQSRHEVQTTPNKERSVFGLVVIGIILGLAVRFFI